jgi:hypothetical protein
MYKALYYICSLLYLPLLSSFTLADRLFKAQKGDFVVTEQDKHYSLLVLKDTSPANFVLEEITVSSDKIHLPGMDWNDWVNLGAPGHSAWIQYEIEKSTLELIECYSYSKKGWLYLDESELFFSTLLSLELLPVPLNERRKIGVAPTGDELDQRPLWTPTLAMNNKKTKLPCEVLKTYWPKDHTALSSCRITLYFPSKENTLFPIWIEANNGHFNYNAKGIYFGKNLSSPTPSSVPKRPVVVTQILNKNKDQKTLAIHAPSYHKTFSLYVFDLLYPEKKIGPIPFSLESTQKKESHLIHVKTEDLNNILQKNRRYKWVVKSKEIESSFAESEDFFVWNP